MNERVMQFRLGMFVIVAGLVLTMLIVWFGESPALFRAVHYVTVHYAEAPGVSEGIPVRKSGIRVGEVVAIRFDDRPKQPDGVLVTMALESKYRIRAGSVPRISRALIGDVSIDLLPGTGEGPMATGAVPDQAPVIEGTVAPDPSEALAAATEAFQNVKGTLSSIDQAAKGVAALSAKADGLDDFLVSIRDAARKVEGLADQMSGMAKSSSGDFPAVVAGIKAATEKFNATFDDATRSNLQASSRQLSSVTSKFDKILSDFQPVARDLAADPSKTPTTNVGQVMLRANRVIADVGLLTAALRTYDPGGKARLNPNGTIQKLLISSELHDSYQDVAKSARAMVGKLSQLAEQIARDPSALSRGVLQGR